MAGFLPHVEKQVWLRRLQPAEPFEALHRDSAVKALAISPDNHTLAIGCGVGVESELWDMATHHLKTGLGTQHGSAESLAFSANGKILATGNDGSEVGLWDVATGTNLWIFEGDTWVRSVAISDDGKWLAAAQGGNPSSSDASSLRVWNIQAKTLASDSFSLRGACRSLCFSRDSRHLAAANAEGTVKVWDTRNWKEESSHTEHQKHSPGFLALIHACVFFSR